MAGYAYQRFFADSNPNNGADHLNFTLGGDQGSIGLFMPDLTIIDCVAYQPQRANISQGRSPNGTAAIVFFNTPTPGAPNPLASVNPLGGALVINEVLTHNTTEIVGTNGATPSWIEIYNGRTNTAVLTDLSLTDDTVQPRRYVFTNGTQIAAGGYLRILCSGGEPASANNTGFGLKSSAGGSVYLFDAPANGGSLLSAITYGIQTADFSIGRVPDGSTNWVLTSPTAGGANVAVPALGNPVTSLHVNEWMAAPASGDDWFEIYNSSTLPVALGGLYVTDDLNGRTKYAPIAPLSFIGIGSNAWLRINADNNPGAGADHVNFAFKAGGEDVGISTTNGTLIDGYSFGPQVSGVSQGRFPDGSTNVVSFPGTASPGESNYRLLTQVVINEALTHTDEPLEDAIELRNVTGQMIDISGWWLSDDPHGTLQKYQIPANTQLAPFGFTVIYEVHFTNRLEAAVPFALSSHGDEIVLCTASNNVLTGYRTSVSFGAADNGVSFGRYITSDGREEFVAMSARTFGVDDPSSVQQFRQGTGATNAYPRVGPLIISEIMYHPPDLNGADNSRDEFIELRNITTVPVPLFDPAFPTNTWHIRDAVDFNFPTNITIPAGQTLLVVSFDPINDPITYAAFRNAYQIDLSQPVVGPYQGKLKNSSSTINLRKPGTPDADGVPYILVEGVGYSDMAPWPINADGTGLSLQRVSDTGFGDDPTNWVAAVPTPGPQATNADSDTDGIPDSWEIAHGLNPYDKNDAGLDLDGDGLTNLQEYQLGTDPRNAQSGLSFSSIGRTGTNVVLTFAAASNYSYVIEFTDTLGSGNWQELTMFTAASTNRTINFTVAPTQARRFFRLKIPMAASPPVSLQINSIQTVPAGVTLTFSVPANQACLIEWANQPAGGTWSTLQSYSAVSTNRVIQWNTSATSPSFYRLHSP